MTELHRLQAALADDYTVEREIGAGGMATVYLAEDLKHGRRVAVKVLRPEVLAGLGRERFLREIAITAQLTHPNILPLHDSGDIDGLLFYVMPFVDGETLRHRLNRERQLPIDDAVRLTSEIADALASAHRRGVIHRDIKPENILLEEGHAVVADFGIARAMNAAGGDKLTQTGLAIGTPSYMSPEQLSGDSDINEASDIYSLGCVAYEMLAGSPPFAGATLQSLLAQKSTNLNTELRAARNDISDTIRQAVAKSLAMNPSDRFQSATEFAAALTPAATGPESRLPLLAVGAAAGIVAVTALGFMGLIPGIVRPAAANFFRESDQIVVAEFDNDTDQPALGLAIREAVATDLEQSEYVNVVEQTAVNNVLRRMRRPDSTRLDLETALEVAQREGFPAIITGSVIAVGTGYQLSVQIVEASTGEVAVRLRKTAAGDGDVLNAVEQLTHLTRRHLGESLSAVRRSQPLPSVTTSSLEALQMMARGSDHARRGLSHEAIPFGIQAVELDSAFAYAHRALSIWYFNQGNPIKAQTHINLAHRFNDRLLPRERFLVGATRSSFRGDLDSAVVYYGLLLDRFPNDLTGLNNLGDVRERMGQYDEALTLYRRAMETGGSAGNYLNVASAARTLGLQTLADSVFLAMADRYPGVWNTWLTQVQNAFFAGRYSRTEQIANDMLHSEFPFPPVFGAYMMSSLSAIRGQIGRSISFADSSTQLAVGVSTPFLHLPLWTAQYAALAAGTPEVVLPLLDDASRLQNLGTAPRFEYATLGILANGYALAGRSGVAEQLLARMDSLVDAVGIHPPGLSSQIRATLLLNANRPDESLEYLQQARSAEFGLLHHTTRFLLAQTYDALERWDDAAAHYDSLTTSQYLNYNDVWAFGPVLPMALERAANSYLMLGDTTTAAARLSTFIELWDEAEPALQPVVADARLRLSQLVGEHQPR